MGTNQIAIPSDGPADRPVASLLRADSPCTCSLLSTRQSLAFLSLRSNGPSLFLHPTPTPTRPSNPLDSYPAHLPCNRAAHFCLYFHFLLLCRPDCHPRVLAAPHRTAQHSAYRTTPYHPPSPIFFVIHSLLLRRSTAGAPANGRPRDPSATVPSTDTRPIHRVPDGTSRSRVNRFVKPGLTASLLPPWRSPWAGASQTTWPGPPHPPS